MVYQKHQRNAEARDKLVQLQRLKFGQEVDLETMEGAGLNVRAEDLKVSSLSISIVAGVGFLMTMS